MQTTVKTLLETQLNSNVSALVPPYLGVTPPAVPPISWDNVNIAGADQWMRFSIAPMLPIKKSVGSANPTEWYAGVAFAQAFQRRDTGAWLNSKLLDSVAAIFRNQDLIDSTTGIRVIIDEFAYQMDVGTKGDYLQSNLQIRFRAQRP